MVTNSVVVIDRNDASQMYAICRMKINSLQEEGHFEFSEINGLEKFPKVTPAIQAAAKRFAASEGSIYIPLGKSFLTVNQEGENYHVLQINPFNNTILESVEKSRNFMKAAYLAHLEGLRLGLFVEYHFNLPIGHKNVRFYPTNPNNHGIGPMFSQASGRGEAYALRLESLKKVKFER